MHERTAPHQRPPVVWALVADSKQAHIYACHKIIHQVPLSGGNKHHYYDEKSVYELTPVSNGVLEAESIDDYQLGHDRRGTASNSNSSAHNTYEPQGDTKEELKRRFTRTIASKLQIAAAKRLFDRLVLVAPAKMVGELRQQLSTEVQNRIVAVLPKELTHFQGAELLAHLEDTLAEAQVA